MNAFANLFNSPAGKILFYGGVLCLSSLLYSLLFLIKNGGKRTLFRRLFYIPANKASTRTLLLGGLPVSVTFLGLMGAVLMGVRLDESEAIVLRSSFVLFVGVLFYGYMDDRFEIRPILKLMCQVLIMTTFSFLTSKTLFPENSVVPFLVNFFIGMTVLNGANLLDGLDTLSSKVFLATLMYFAFLIPGGTESSLMVLVIGSLCAIAPFYFLNRAPAKVYLGEIGAGAIASMVVLLGNLFYLGFRHSKFPSFSFVSASFPFMIFGVELSVSFLRRLLNKRSPFKGDKLHVHHLLVREFELRPSTVGTIYGIGQFGLCFCGYLMVKTVGHWPAFCLVPGVLYLSYYLQGRRHWIGKDFVPISLSSLFNLTLKKKVKIISDSALNDFQIHILHPEIRNKDENREAV